jgi:hypothetical protein
LEHFPEKCGFPQKMRQNQNLERFPVQLNRKALWPDVNLNRTIPQTAGYPRVDRLIILSSPATVALPRQRMDGVVVSP